MLTAMRVMINRHSIRPTTSLLLAVGLLIAGSSLAFAQTGRKAQPSEKSPAKKGQADGRRPDTVKQTGSEKRPDTAERAIRRGETEKRFPGNDVAVTPGREAAALTFARLHHPELAELLEQLARTNRPEYQKAVRELFQASEKLARLAEQRSTERYELALDAWKIDSRIRLLAARMTMSDNPALESELKTALEERLRIRLAQLHFDRKRAVERLEQLDESIEAIEQNRDAALHRELERVKRGLPPRREKPAGRRSDDRTNPNGNKSNSKTAVQAEQE